MGVEAIAADYFDVVTIDCNMGSDGGRFVARIDFPVAGGEDVMRGVKQWMAEVLGIDDGLDVMPDAFGKALGKVANEWTATCDGTSRKVEITWLYEDPTCVSYDAVITDNDSLTWTTSIVASFSKADGHKVTANEVFACDEKQIKRLMWRYRGNLTMEVASPDELYVGDVAFIDGWILVIGPAKDTSGAEYRLRYPEVEKWLVPANGKGYLAY